MTSYTNVHFTSPVSIGGRAITDTTSTGGGYTVEPMETFPWVMVRSKARPSEARVTTVFNITSRDALPEELAPPAPAQPVSPSKPAR